MVQPELQAMEVALHIELESALEVHIELESALEAPTVEPEQVREELLVPHAVGIAAVAHAVVGLVVLGSVHQDAGRRMVTILSVVCQVKCSIPMSRSVSPLVVVPVHACQTSLAVEAVASAAGKIMEVLAGAR